MKNCIVNFVTKNAWYEAGQERLKKSLDKFGYDGDFLAFNNETLKCPSHKEVPYGFKPWSVMKAKEMGYKKIVWLDASFWAIRPLDYLFSHLEKNGSTFQSSSFKLGTWCSDKALNNFGISREESFKMPLFSGGLTGINLNFDSSVKFLERWYNYSKDGVSFQGSWKNKNSCVSKDSRVKGHRHDMSVSSFVANKLNMKIYPNNTFFSYYEWYEKYKSDPNFNTDNIVFVIRGGL